MLHCTQCVPPSTATLWCRRSKVNFLSFSDWRTIFLENDLHDDSVWCVELNAMIERKDSLYLPTFNCSVTCPLITICRGYNFILLPRARLQKWSSTWQPWKRYTSKSWEMVTCTIGLLHQNSTICKKILITLVFFLLAGRLSQKHYFIIAAVKNSGDPGSCDLRVFVIFASFLRTLLFLRREEKLYSPPKTG